MFSVTSLKLPDGTATNTPESVAVDADGTSAMVYWAQNGTRSGIALLDNAGHQLRVFETEPYKPAQVCFAPDHSIWVYGDQWKTASSLESDFMLFRHYSRDGKLIGSYVPRSELPTWEGLGIDQLAAPFVSHWRMRAAKDRIGAAFNLSETKQLWVELDFNGKLLGQWSSTDSPEGYVMPAAFDSQGVLYGDHGSHRNRYDGVSILDKTTGTWKPVSSLPAGHLVGAPMELAWCIKKGDQLKWVPGLSTDLIETAAAAQP